MMNQDPSLICMTDLGSKRLMQQKDAARYLGVSPSTLRKLGIPRKILGDLRLYERADLDGFADGLDYEGTECRKNTADDAFL